MPTNDPMGEGDRAASVATLNGSQPEGNQTLIGKCIGGDEKAGDKHVRGDGFLVEWTSSKYKISLPPFYHLLRQNTIFGWNIEVIRKMLNSGGKISRGVNILLSNFDFKKEHYKLEIIAN